MSSSSAPTGSRPTATPRTRSGRTRWPCSRPATASRSTSPHRSAPSTLAPRPVHRHPHRGALRAKRSSISAARAIAPPDTDVRNPAFDVTPAELISGIVTEEGVVRPPYETSLAEAVAARQQRRGPRPGLPRSPARSSRREEPSTDGVGRDHPSPDDARASDDRPGRPARVPVPGPAVRGVRDLRPRGPRVQRGRAGERRSTATRSWRSGSNTPGPRRSRCS